MLLVEIVYKVTTSFPNEEKFGLISQMRRAAISGPSNIAEGAADRSPSQFANFLSVAIGSLAELDTQLELSKNLGFINSTDFQEVDILIDKTKSLVYGLRKSIKTKG